MFRRSVFEQIKQTLKFWTTIHHVMNMDMIEKHQHSRYKSHNLGVFHWTYGLNSWTYIWKIIVILKEYECIIHS